MKCPSCNNENLANYNFCLTCGYDLKAYREAFPHGVPPAGPTPEPARTGYQERAATPPPTAVATESGVWADLSANASLAAQTFPPAPKVAMADTVVSKEGTVTQSTPPGTLPPVQMPPPPSMPPRLGTPSQAYMVPDIGSRPMAPLSPLLPLTPAPGGALPRAATQGMSPPAAAPPAIVTTPPVSQTAEVPVGASGGLPCAQCGAMNGAGMRFCGSCGGRLSSGHDTSVPHALAGPPRTMFMHAADTAAQLQQQRICKLVTIDQSGREGMTFTIKSGETLCGRVNGVVLFFDDPYVSPTHCQFGFFGQQLKVTDQGSLNGVYVRLRAELELQGDEHVRIGRQLFRFEYLDKPSLHLATTAGDDSKFWGSPTPAAFARLVQILDDGRMGEVRLLCGDKTQIGREQGEILLPTDGFVSGKHCVFTNQGGRVTLTDVGSSNGTYVRIRDGDVGHGDFLLVGNQMLRVEII
jgi:pSer/pThr/pTyr-binding forkhead associated (FHA) protein